MTFEEAEARFRQLQARVQRGEPISRAEYEEQVSQLAVQDNNGQLWEINPRTSKWMYFDGAEWVSGTPPGYDTSQIIPMPGGSSAASTPPSAPKPIAPLPARQSAPSASTSSASEPVPTYKRVTQDKKPATTAKPTGAPQAPELSARPNRVGAMGRREWIPFVIGAVVLLVCAVGLFVGGNLIVNTLSPTKAPTPTRTTIAAANSPVPTIVRLPSPTPLPPTPAPVTAKITTDTPANVRNKPTVSGTTILTKLKKDTAITLIAAGPVDGANQWYQINLPDNAAPGWIRNDTFTVTSGDPKTLPLAGVTPTPTAKATAVPAPAQPTATATVLGVIPPTPTTKP